MSEKRKFVMTDDQLAKILDACKPVAAIALQCGMPPSQHENANRAWQALGKEIGFDWKTVESIRGKPDTHFTAMPL